MEVVGEEGTAIDDMVVYLKAELYDFSYLQQNAFDKEDAYCPLKRQIKQFSLINRIFDTHFDFSTHDEARDFFLNLQNQVKNLNYMTFDSGEYRSAHEKLIELIQSREKQEVLA
jgi:V/A-type H+-transporting ATPase subunit A